jgi:hypothetical protein
MVGVDLGSKAREYYYRIDLLSWESLMRMLEPLDFSGQPRNLVDFLHTVFDGDPDYLLPGKGWGFSVATASDGSPSRFSLFAPVRRFFGPDEQLQEALAEYCRTRGVSLRYLEAALRAWDEAIAWGFAALVPEPDGIRLDIGFAPGSAARLKSTGPTGHCG